MAPVTRVDVESAIRVPPSFGATFQIRDRSERCIRRVPSSTSTRVALPRIGRGGQRGRTIRVVASGVNNQARDVRASSQAIHAFRDGAIVFRVLNDPRTRILIPPARSVFDAVALVALRCRSRDDPDGRHQQRRSACSAVRFATISHPLRCLVESGREPFQRSRPGAFRGAVAEVYAAVTSDGRRRRVAGVVRRSAADLAQIAGRQVPGGGYPVRSSLLRGRRRRPSSASGPIRPEVAAGLQQRIERRKRFARWGVVS